MAGLAALKRSPAPCGDDSESDLCPFEHACERRPFELTRDLDYAERESPGNFGELDALPDGRIFVSCPWALLRDRTIGEVASLYWWREKGGLRRSELTAAAVDAIDAYATGIGAAERQHREDVQKRNKTKGNQ